MNKLFIVATPIGNKADLSLRAIETLKEVDIIFCEDTRHSKFLLNHYEIKTKLESMHKFNEVKKTERIRQLLDEGKKLAIISDAGSPTISDPGNILLSKIPQEFISPIPGPSSIIALLSATTLRFNTFSFIGFLDKKEQKLVKQIRGLHTDIVVFFESPNRLNKTIEILKENFPKSKITIGRELTKKYEEIITQEISTFDERIWKGEIVVAISIRKIKEDNGLKYIVEKLKNENYSNRQIIYLLTTLKNFKKNDIYKELKENE